VCLFLEGCGLINYIFIVVFLLGLTHSTYLLSSVIEDLLLYLTLLFNFCTHRLPVINEPKIHLFPVITNREINTLDIEYKSSLLRGNGFVVEKTVMLYKPMDEWCNVRCFLVVYC
jgi:hypothetical protein